MSSRAQVSLFSHWFVKDGQSDAVIAALDQMAQDIRSHEPGTLTYLVHTTTDACGTFASLPSPGKNTIVFFEVYKDAAAFEAHVNGAIFTQFVKDYGHLFHCVNGKPYTTLQFLTRQTGFIGREKSLSDQKTAGNQHPGVMFEVIANDLTAMKAFYSDVFGWTYDTGTGGFGYVHFPDGSPPLLGGIGQAQLHVAGFDPGTNFYLLVDDLQTYLDRAIAAGATPLMPATEIDGFRFAMFNDPENNPVGLIEPFTF